MPSSASGSALLLQGDAIAFGIPELGYPDALVALLPAATAPLYLEQLTRSDYDPLRLPGEPSPLHRQWRLWRASRGVGL